MRLRVAIVGAGRMGRERARAAKELQADVSTVCDADLGRAAALAADVGAKAVGATDEIELSDLDAVFVCTPPSLHGPVEARAIEVGIGIFVEKPIGLTAHHCSHLVDILRRRPVINAVGYMNRYRESVLEARSEIKNGAVIGAAFQWFATEYRVPWWLDPEQSGGPVNEQCTHYIDLCRFLVGEVAEVQAIAQPLAHAPAAEGTVAINLLFQQGVVGTGLYSCKASQKQMAFEVFLPDRSVRLQGWDLRRTSDNSNEDIFVKEVSAFFQAIESGDASQVHSSIESALKTQSIVDAIRQAIRTGKRERVLDCPGLPAVTSV